MSRHWSIGTPQTIESRHDSKQNVSQSRASLITTKTLKLCISKASERTDINSGESTTNSLARSTSQLSRVGSFASNVFKRGHDIFRSSPSERQPSEDEYAEELDPLEKPRISRNIITSAPSPPLSQAVKNLAATIETLNVDSMIRRKKKGKQRAKSPHLTIACKRSVASVCKADGDGKPTKVGQGMKCLQIVVGRTGCLTSARKKGKFLAEEEAPWGAHRSKWEPPYEGPSDWWRRPPPKKCHKSLAPS